MEAESGEIVNDPKREVARLSIILHADSTIRVEGPISDKMISYALLENARDAIFEHGMRVKVKPNGSVMNFIRGLK